MAKTRQLLALWTDHFGTLLHLLDGHIGLSLPWSLWLLYTCLCCACPGVNPRVKSGRFMKLLPDYEHMDYRDVYTHCMYMGIRVHGGCLSGTLNDLSHYQRVAAVLMHPVWAVAAFNNSPQRVCRDVTVLLILRYCNNKRCLSAVVNMWWYQMIGLLGKKCSFVSAAVQQSRGNWELQR